MSVVSVDADELPRFAELPVRPGAPSGSSWGVFGENDEIGTLNLITSEQVRAATALVQRGDVFSLAWDLSGPAPSFFTRHGFSQTIMQRYGGVLQDDYLDSFYLQSSTHWDGLRHVGDPEYGFYNGVPADEAAGSGRLGIEHWARRGIVARAVLLDIAAIIDLDPFEFAPIGADLLGRAVREAGVELRRGDVLLLRTGWLQAYRKLRESERIAMAEQTFPGAPGLYGEEIPPFLWDHRIAAVASDNPTLEASKPGVGSDLALHKALIARLGMPLGELWHLDDLADDCAHDGVYEFLLTSAPLALVGGVGSPANPLVLK